MRPLLIAAILLVPSAAFADEPRYRMEPSGDGFVRMDTETGRMDYCVVSAGQLACHAAAGSESAADPSLEQRLAALEKRLAELETAAPAVAGLPSDAEFERGLGYMERFFRSFIGIARELSDKPAPDRT